MRARTVLSLLLLAVLLAVQGCGSKITEANYYRVHHGMTEEKVEAILGPPHDVVALPPAVALPDASTTRPVERKVMSWSRGGITLRVEFTDGRVTGRSAEGIPAENLQHQPAEHKGAM